MRRRSKLMVLIWIFCGTVLLYIILFQFTSSTPNNNNILTYMISSKEYKLSIPLHSYNESMKSSYLRTTVKEYSSTQIKTPLQNEASREEKPRDRFEVVLAAVACGDRLRETLVMVKSAILFSTNVSLRVVVFADTSLLKGFEEKLDEWKLIMNNTFNYELHYVTFPENGKEEWRKLFKPCAAQRLFLPSLLKQYDSVLYVDTDTLFLTPLEDIWRHFDRMNSTQMAALSPEHEDPNTGWYNRFARHPYYGKLGVNSGVMLMNLTRMRQFGWEQYLSPIYKTFRLKITWGDQDIINIIFHYHPERLYIYSCRYNYRSDHCMYMSVCRDAHAHGVAVVHGSRGTFHSDRQNTFKAIFSAMEEYQLGTDAYQNLLLPLENSLDATSHTNCGKVRNIFTKNLHIYLAKEQFR